MSALIEWLSQPVPRWYAPLPLAAYLIGQRFRSWRRAQLSGDTGASR